MQNNHTKKQNIPTAPILQDPLQCGYNSNNDLLIQKQAEFHFALSRFSHEIRNPIALINSELQMIADAHPEVTSYTYWDDLMDNLEYTKDLLCSLSEYNNAGCLSLQCTKMYNYLNSVLSSITSTCQYLGISLEAQITEDLPDLSIDRVKMRQALLNLFRNAMEAVSQPGGKIKFAAYTKQNRIYLSIQDNGCGISATQLPDIFRPFVTFKENGTGLGLAVTKQIIESHNGKIQVQSVPGCGTTFLISLDSHDFKPDLKHQTVI